MTCSETKVAKNRNDYQHRRLSVLLVTGTISFFNSFNYELNYNACLVKHFISLDALVFLFAGTILHFNSFILIIAITILAYLVKSSISYPKTNAFTETVDISVFDHCDLLEKANHLTVKFRDDCIKQFSIKSICLQLNVVGGKQQQQQKRQDLCASTNEANKLIDWLNLFS